MGSDLRTPLKSVRALGSAKAGTEHFWLQRLTAVANLVLVIGLIALLVMLAGADYETTRRALANPLVAVGFLALIVSGLVHMRLGMQVVIEDYVHGEKSKVFFLLLNTFFAVIVGAFSLLAVLKISLGA